MRKKFTLLLLLLLVASLTLSGCSLVVKDKVKDAAQIILSVNGDTVAKEEYLRKLNDEENYLNNYYAYYTQMYQYYGISGYSAPSPTQIHAEALKNVHDGLVKDFILKQKGAELGQDTLTDESDTPEQVFIGKERISELYAKLADVLSKQEREIFWLSVSGLSYDEIAEKLGGNPDAHRKRYSRALNKLGELLLEEGYEG